MLYTVRVSVHLSSAKEWTRWMRETHIPEVMATGCFEGATMAREPQPDSVDVETWVMVYRAKSAEDFELYQREHAAALQREHTQRYERVVHASRTLLPIFARFEDPTA